MDRDKEGQKMFRYCTKQHIHMKWELDRYGLIVEGREKECEVNKIATEIYTVRYKGGRTASMRSTLPYRKERERDTETQRVRCNTVDSQTQRCTELYTFRRTEQVEMREIRTTGRFICA